MEEEKSHKAEEVNITHLAVLWIIIITTLIIIIMLGSIFFEKEKSPLVGRWYEYQYYENGKRYRNKDWDKANTRFYIEFYEDHTGIWKKHLVDYHFTWRIPRGEENICEINLEPENTDHYNIRFRTDQDNLVISTREGFASYFTKFEGYSSEDMFPDNPKAIVTPTPIPTIPPSYNSAPYDDTYEDSDSTYSDTEDEYIFPDSDQRYLTEDDIYGMTKSQINLAKNELYARRGRSFNTKELQEYFESCSWYIPLYTPTEWEKKGDKYFFNKFEMANRNFLKEAEEE